jgi:hypothetical protein
MAVTFPGNAFHEEVMTFILGERLKTFGLSLLAPSALQIPVFQRQLLETIESQIC